MKKKILFGGLGLITLSLIILNLNSYQKHLIVFNIKLTVAIIALTILYIRFIKMIKDDKDKAQELDYRLPAPNVAKLKKINKKLGKS